MYAILGATGKVGLSTCQHLRASSPPVPVRAILSPAHNSLSPAKSLLLSLGCSIAHADLHFPSSLASALSGADTVQVILPPNPTHTDPAGDMRDMIEHIATALEQVKPRRVLVVSDYGAHVERDIGMPSMLRAFEDRIARVS
jgi:NAD(P)H dehydrogenase (quinone)